jgi:hypothetical protein
MTPVRPRGADGRFIAFAAAQDTKTTRPTRRQRGEAGQDGLDRHWRTYFLQALAETSNVARSAAAVGAAPSRAYKLRREDPAFAALWRAALLEGYDHLEMEVLGYLRDTQPARKMDVASALRLLAAHRETVARERALREDDDEQAVLDSIDQFIEDMRQRRLANGAILLEARRDDGDD